MSSDPESQRVSAISDIIKRIVTAHRAGLPFKLDELKMAVARKYKLSHMMKTVEIISAIPEQWRKKLVPLIKAKPVRSRLGLLLLL